MDFHVQLPHPALQPYIQHYAFVEIGRPDRWSTLAMAPPGCGVLGAVVGDNKIVCVDGEAPSPAALLTYAGQLTAFKEVQVFGQQVLVYAVMKPCGAYRILGIGQHNCVNRSSDLLDLLPVKERWVLHQFEDCQRPQQTLAVLETLLLRLLLHQTERHPQARIAAISGYFMEQAHQALRIKVICREAGFSKSTLERHFMEFVGIGPKQFHRIVRFNNALRHVGQLKELRHWTEVVYRFGYYDQAHFIKDFKLFYGKIPSSFSATDERLSTIVH